MLGCYSYSCSTFQMEWNGAQIKLNPLHTRQGPVRGEMAK